MRCNACSSTIPRGARFCMSCGAARDASSRAPTEIGPRLAVVRDPESSDSGDGGRFSAGTILANRYRIVGLVGRGGMGEVYRADDLKLGYQVALKFLPAPLAADAGRLARFHNEVRVARQVSHPNVCRVYDIGEVEGQHYLSMEYVHGEDLATLLRKIGHFSHEKSIQIARQICAGLAAAHDKGVIHRDLKPSNVMLDEEGKVRLTDFGLASLGGDLHANEVRAGTPYYMSPEQLSGQGVSVKSDIYSLGLVLYELFTGVPAFQASTIPGPAHRDGRIRPSTPSTHVPGIDAAVECVILRCLEEDPASRPASAIAVAAALPGGDPLAAALAAGETPSPEMVAAAGREGAMRPAVAWTLLAATLAGLGVTLWLGRSLCLAGKLDLPKEPGALLDRSRQILDALGHPSAPVDSAHGFSYDADYIAYIEEKDPSGDRWSHLSGDRPAVIQFWYRESPRPMIADPAFTVIGLDDPPATVSGMTSVVLDPDGSLSMFLSVPPQVVEAGEDPPPGPPDWSLLFEEARLDRAAFAPATPSWTPPVNTDVRAAWVEAAPERPGNAIRVEAGGFDGRVVFFRMIGAWTRPERMEPVRRTTAERLSEILGLSLFVLALPVSAHLARRNLSLGRGDLSGAFKLAFFFVGVHVIVWAFWADHVTGLEEERQIFTIDTGYTLFLALVVWLVYMAIEPFVRRRWPGSMISWSRVLAGGFRDPLVGHDILVGSLAGSIALLLVVGADHVPWLLGWPPPRPLIGNVSHLLGIRWAAPKILDVPVHAVLQAMEAVFFFLLLRLVLRVQWLAAVAFVVLFTPVVALDGSYLSTDVVFGGLVVALFTFVMIRFGLLALTTAAVFVNTVPEMVLTSDLTAWYAESSILALLVVTGIAIYGFHTAMAGQPLFGRGLLED